MPTNSIDDPKLRRLYESDLALVIQYVVKAKQFVAKQRARIVKLKDAGRSTLDAEPRAPSSAAKSAVNHRNMAMKRLQIVPRDGTGL
jgi:hypothetical protein